MKELLLAMAAGLSWERLPDLPAPVSGQMAGVSNGALLVLGGSNFPIPLFQGGTKVWVNSVFALEPGAREWKTARLPRPAAYGGSVTTSRGVIVIGGGDAQQNFRDVTLYIWESGRLRGERLPPLPAPLANCAAASLGAHVYVTGGQDSPTAESSSRRLLRLDLNHPGHWEELEPLPGPGRILPVFAASADDLYLFSGAELTPARRYLTDGWRYRPGRGWDALPSAPRPMVAAPNIFANGALYVFGGDDGILAPRIQELKDGHPGFHRDILRFDPAAGKWTEAGEIPLSLVTTTPVVWRGNVVVPGGEDRPGHRSAAVLALPLGQLEQRNGRK